MQICTPSYIFLNEQKSYKNAGVNSEKGTAGIFNFSFSLCAFSVLKLFKLFLLFCFLCKHCLFILRKLQLGKQKYLYV